MQYTYTKLFNDHFVIHRVMLVLVQMEQLLRNKSLQCWSVLSHLERWLK